MIVDILFLIAAGYGFYLGFSRGIIKTVFTVLSIMIGVVAAAKFGPAMTDFLESVANSHSPLMFIAGLLLTFVATMLLIRIAANVAEKRTRNGQHQYHQPGSRRARHGQYSHFDIQHVAPLLRPLAYN
ncbi:MAG: CvpA family protein [Saprospiraceae bacterium]|nr:CvpA family protein [Saprospiraceae bacterium]